MPKSNINGYGIRQKDHRLKYLSFEGDLNENESIEVSRRGLFITHSWTLSYENNNFIKLNFKDGSGSFEDMWKKTDFKISLDEIKLYEITDPAHFQKDREISSRVIEPPVTEEAPKESPPSPLQKVQEKAVEVQVSLAQEPSSVENADQGPKLESTAEPEIETKSQDKEISSEESSENISAETPNKNEVQTASQPIQDTLKKTIMVEEAEISYTPVQEFILDETGKPNEEYKKK